MLRSLNVGVTSMIASNDALTVVSNNIANTKTNGYKSRTANFEELFSQQVKAASGTRNGAAGSNPVEVGNGVKMGSISIDQTQGNVTYTGRATDMAMSGEGFFVVGDSTGKNSLFTRNGAFQLTDDYRLATSDGMYVLGWNVDKMTGEINTGASLGSIKLGINETSKPVQTTKIALQGNLDIAGDPGTVYGLQVPTYDLAGQRHDIDLNYVKTSGNTFRYVGSPADQFISSASVKDARLNVDTNVAAQLVKGNYNIASATSATPGMVDITVTDPNGVTVLTKTINDVTQSVSLDDGLSTWFTIEYKSGGIPSSSSFQVAEVGDITIDTATGQITGLTGSGAMGRPQFSYQSLTTMNPVIVDVSFDAIRSFASDSNLQVLSTDGSPASVLKSFSVGDGGIISGFYDDGSIKQIAKIAVGKFSNPSGLSHVGGGKFTASPNSGPAEIGEAGTGSRGQISAMSLESSNVDLATQFTDMMTTQKLFQAGTKIIRTGDDVLSSVLQLIR
jgi:flagellar hook protein FlgE